MNPTIKSEQPPPLEEVPKVTHATSIQQDLSEVEQLSDITEDDAFTNQSIVSSLQLNKDTRELNEQRAIYKEKTAKAEARIESDPWDTEAWTTLIMEAQTKDIQIAREVYERFLKVFPTAGRYWKYYAEHEMAAKIYDRVDAIFKRCLLQCPNIDLWRCYVNYVQLVKQNEPNGREQIIEAYEFAIDKMGMDLSFTPVWTDYITFLKEYKPKNQHEEGQKMNMLRKVYQRAIETPIHNLEAIWKEYDTFENELNKTLAKALLSEHASKYMQARSIYRERKRYYEGILRNMLARPPLTGANKEEHQISLWKRLITYEKTNPQKLDANGLRARINFTYNQCLLCLYHYPEVWFDFASEEATAGYVKEATDIFERALQALPDCLILYFAYANMLESNKNIKAAKDVYEKLVESKTDSLVFIQYMKFARRTEGTKAARAVFRKGRNSPSCSHHLFTAAALMEWQLNKDTQVARNVFDLGMNKFGSEPAFVLEYIRFLTHLNEENNMRVLFERAISLLPSEKAQEVWNLYLAFEYNYGDLTTISKVKSRKATLYPELHLAGILSLVHRYRYLDLWPCSNNELESFGKALTLKEDTSGGNVDSAEDGGSSVVDPLKASKTNPKLSKFPRPDLSQMILYKPEMANITPMNMPQLGMNGNSSSTPAASLPPQLPDIIAQFIMNLPSTSFQGPVPEADQLIALLRDTPLPPPPAPEARQQESQNKKRKVEEEDEDEEDQSTNPANPPPSNDLFRQRQAAKLSKQKF